MQQFANGMAYQMVNGKPMLYLDLATGGRQWANALMQIDKILA